MATFNSLPAAIQQIFINTTGMSAADYQGVYFKQSQQQNYQSLYTVPYLMYDFSESNYSVELVNLVSVCRCDAGPAMSEIVKKKDPNLPAYIVIVGGFSCDETPNQVIECV